MVGAGDCCDGAQAHARPPDPGEWRGRLVFRQPLHFHPGDGPDFGGRPVPTFRGYQKQAHVKPMRQARKIRPFGVRLVQGTQGQGK